MLSEIRYQPIGIIHSPFNEPKGMPIQTILANTNVGTVEIFAEFQEALKDLNGFSHIFLLYHFHRAKPFQPLVTPFFDQDFRGLFATRAPARPNAIGLSVVELLSIADGILHVRGIDVMEGTPLLDIKPYIPDFDRRDSCSTGWFGETNKAARVDFSGGADDRFTQQ